ncbi:MAG: T9SS type A sorting domain-containing protein [Ignavibacteriales bacterium]|nr:MAG: T9SS type A sorting domain-containing protein [Ignavibacteriales bacterium]
MKRLILLVVLICFTFIVKNSAQQSIIADHSTAKLSLLQDAWIDSAKAKLHIAYGHTSHGSQIITGMDGLENWKGVKFAFNEGGTNGALDIDDNAFPGASDLGNPDRTAWATATRNYLNNSANSDVNVVIWSWCGQVSSATETDINTYLNLMTGLENDFPNVKFVYMTGHLDGSGLTGNLHQRNQQIRNYCITNNKILYDFNDIESYDPDGNYFLDRDANDNCDYDSDNNGSLDKNWATDWQNTHTLNVDWYQCSAAHSQPLNGNLKAYAAWWLWTRLAGWNPVSNVEVPVENPKGFILYQNYPNPFNPSTTISWQSSITSRQTLKIYYVLGNEIAVLIDEIKPAGKYEIEFNSSSGISDLVSGIYFYKLQVGEFTETRKMILLK